MLRRWANGLVVGLVVGVGVLVGGPIAGGLGLAAALLLAARPPRMAPVGGLLLGLGASWLLLLARADASCGADCVGPDLRPWFLVGGIGLGLGLVLSAQAWRSARDPTRSDAVR